ncbi:tetratricopeptide repeat protein [Constantimarinum furrinae]|uniref:Uncharacterized protein n=1 Tax=Constantimarinum furrinae TaxID=2562285 RepID=A0A7G8PUY3_9FLAO|nr:hypothetical protein [Constantimarinum furrinae]QNJ98149.1 hypothetical protein ALE3EI_1592 [Constantimarinum furrinae]
MGGGGSIQGFNNSLKENRKLLKKTRFFPAERSFLNRKREYVKRAGGVESLRNASKEELLAIRNSIVAKRKKDSLVTIVLFVILASVVAYFSVDYFKTNPNYVSEEERLEIKNNNEKYNFYISDGDSYLNKGQWHNAIFQYNKALEIFPNNYDALYRSVYAQVYRCRNTKENCESAKSNLEQLLNKFPEKQDLIELEQVLVFVDPI